MNIAVVMVPGWWGLTAGAEWMSVRAANLLETAEGRRALLEATRSHHRSVAELSAVWVETGRINGAMSQRWSWPWTDGTISAVPPVCSCSPQVKGVDFLLGETDIPALASLWQSWY